MEVGRFGTQTQRLLAVFPREQVKVILCDDFAASPQQVYDEVIAFLGKPHGGRTDFPRINDNKRAKVAWLRNFIRKPPPLLRKTYRGLKAEMGAGPLDAIRKDIVDRNTVKERRRPLSPEFRAELVEAFRDEVALLSRLLNRDLSHWV